MKLKKGERISSLTFGQARVRGISFKRWKRAVAIKEGIAKAKKLKQIEKITEEQIKEKIIIKEKPRTYFVNFNFTSNPSGNETSGIFGSLISPFFISINEARQIIKENLPFGYDAFNFYGAIEYSEQKTTELIILRDGDEVFSKTISRG